MEHQEAIETHAAEGYILGDLTAADYAAFEEHFADCDTCFADVRDGATIIAAARAEAKPVRVPGGQPYKFIPNFAVAASVAVALLSIVAGYQGVQLAQLRKPHIVADVQLPGDQRGPAEAEVAADGSKPFALNFDITLDPAAGPFTCRIVDAQGKTRGDALSVTAAVARYPVRLEVPGGVLKPGEYSLIVAGSGGVSMPAKRFKVR